MMQKEVTDKQFPKLSNRMAYLKTDEGGTDVMCEVMDKYVKQEVDKANIKAVINMLKLKVNEEEIQKLYPKEFEEGKKIFEQTLNM